MTREEFYAMPTIATYFPLTFEGKKRWETFVVTCGRCEKDVGPDDTRGYVVPIYVTRGAYRDAPITAYHVVAQALCSRCALLTTADYTLRSDMSIVGKDPQGRLPGNVVWGGERETFLKRCFESVREIYNTFWEAKS